MRFHCHYIALCTFSKVNLSLSPSPSLFLLSLVSHIYTGERERVSRKLSLTELTGSLKRKESLFAHNLTFSLFSLYTSIKLMKNEAEICAFFHFATKVLEQINLYRTPLTLLSFRRA